MVMPIADYDPLYFDGGRNVHPAGYTRYQRQSIIDSATGLEPLFNYHKGIFDRFNLSGKKVLILGCAKGFEVDDFQALGAALVVGVDPSLYASNNHPDIVVTDAFSYMVSQATDSFDFVVGFRLLPCLDTGPALQVLTQAARVSAVEQYFTVDSTEVYTPEEITNLSPFYNIRPLAAWQNHGVLNTTIEIVEEEF